ncbi:hypothetical protein L596_022424 [Steinernema carpocapsae]|uniref:Uncharacterized protein n=1 Tax=Steinernema carpocapsae TaxID=34508 RepID=A0A4U5MLP1_STECR|nr:hypothetical protein L596_022424 [Steinernema carpocapsae]
MEAGCSKNDNTNPERFGFSTTSHEIERLTRCVGSDQVGDVVLRGRWRAGREDNCSRAEEREDSQLLCLLKACSDIDTIPSQYLIPILNLQIQPIISEASDVESGRQQNPFPDTHVHRNLSFPTEP